MALGHSKPAVSVVIPTYNRAGALSRALSSVFTQTFSDFELIVVDDGSTDETWDVLAGYGDALRKVRLDTNTGVSAARNRGIGEARGDLIAFLDSDDWWRPDKLAVQVDFFQQRPEAMICQTEETWVRNGRRVNPKKRHAKPTGDIFIPSLALCLVSPSAVMMRRELFGSVGMFDESLPACEDYDLWLRIARHHPVHLIETPLVVKTGGHDDQLSRTTKGLDQYRIAALLKLLSAGGLRSDQEAAVRATLARKAKIYGQGCLKRGREDEARYYLDLAASAGGNGNEP